MKKINKRLTAIALSVAVLLTAAVFSVPAVAENVITLLTGTETRTVTVSNTVIQEDFVGLGSNLWLGPKYNGQNNMTDAYYEVNFKRIQTMRPAFMRMMFLPHWLMDLTEDSDTVQQKWKSGKYDDYNWDNENLKFFLEYVAAFKKAGTTVQLNMGGRVDNSIVDWFGIEDVALEAGGKTAPRDLEAFANATAALLKYCWDNGYDNVKYLSFYNEVNGSNYEAFGDKRVYWVSMLRCVNTALNNTYTAKGERLSDVIEVIGTELSFNGDHMLDNVGTYWSGYVTKNASNYFNRLSVHFYHQNIADKTYKDFNNSLISLATNMPGALVTEYMGKTTTGEQSVWTFGTTLASYVASMANNGYSGAASWFFCGAELDRAIDSSNMNSVKNCNWVTPSPGVDGDYKLHYDEDEWETMEKTKVSRMNLVSNAYYEDAMMMRFIPKNGKTLKTTISGNYDLASNENGDIVAAAFKSKDGKDATVMLVVDGSENERSLNLKIDEFNGKTFNKFVLNYADKRETLDKNEIGNALLPLKADSLTATNGTISDTLPTTHSVIIYTTYDEPVQVAFSQLEYKVKAGQDVQIATPEVYGVGENSAVTWKVLCGGGEVNATGKYTADATAKAGDTIAVAAISNADKTAYGVVVITIE